MQKYIQLFIVLTVGFGVGFLVFGGPSDKDFKKLAGGVCVVDVNGDGTFDEDDGEFYVAGCSGFLE